jgi:hypothetical protein
MGCDDVEWIHLAWDRVQWQSLMNKALNITVPWKARNVMSPTIKSLNYDTKIFKPALKDYLFTHSFYSVDNSISAENS